MASDSPDYGYQHAKERRRLKIIIATDGYICARCHQYRPPGSSFDLDHNDADTTTYNGPACIRCNRGAGGRKARARERARLTRSRNW